MAAKTSAKTKTGKTSKNRPKHPRRLSQLGALMVARPEEGAEIVRRAMREAHGRVTYAAKDLGLSLRQMFRLLNHPLLKDVERAPAGPPPKDERQA